MALGNMDRMEDILELVEDLYGPPRNHVGPSEVAHLSSPMQEDVPMRQTEEGQNVQDG